MTNVLIEKVRNRQAQLTKEDLEAIQSRTAQLFEIISLCAEDAESVKVCRQEITELNIRLVSRVLAKYKPFGDDETQIGCVGLIKAVYKFDASKGVPFVNYACFMIERELHVAHKVMSSSFEFLAAGNMCSIDDEISISSGDTVNRHELIADEAAENEFRMLIEGENLDNIFDSIIYPAIEDVAGATRGTAKVDFELWRALELRYILDIAKIDSQKARFTLTNISETLGISRQNVRMRHQRVLEAIRVRCEASGYLIREAQ